MARILSDESTLTRKRRHLEKEGRVLTVVSRAEFVLAGVLLIAGGVVLWLFGKSFVLILGGIVLFLAVGHRMSIREDERERGHVTAGLRGETQITRILKAALPDDTYIFNDLNLKHGFHKAQVDHIVVSPRGLFVIETKNWRGTIRGKEREAQWQQIRNPGDRPVSVSNPIQQNERHVSVLKGCLAKAGIDWPDIISVIVDTSPGSSFDVPDHTVPLLGPDDLVDYIAGFSPDRPHETRDVDAVVKLLMGEP